MLIPVLSDSVRHDLAGGMSVEINSGKPGHSEEILGLVSRKEKLLDVGTAGNVFLEGLVQTLFLEGVIELDAAGIPIEMVHCEAEFPVIEISQGLGTHVAAEKGLVVGGIDLLQAHLIYRKVGHHLLTVESSMMIEQVRVHVGQGGKREIDSPLSVGMEVNSILGEVEIDGSRCRSVLYVREADERHSVIIDVGHSGLKETHLVGEFLELG